MLDIVKKKLIKFVKTHHAGQTVKEKVPLKKKRYQAKENILQPRLHWAFTALAGFLPAVVRQSFPIRRETKTGLEKAAEIEAWPCPSNKIFEFPQTKPIAEFVIFVRCNLTSRDLTSLRLLTRINKKNQTRLKLHKQVVGLVYRKQFMPYSRRKK